MTKSYLCGWKYSKNNSERYFLLEDIFFSSGLWAFQTNESVKTAWQAPSQSQRHNKFRACAFDCLGAISGNRVFERARSCLVTIMGLNGTWPHRRAFACWQPIPALQRAEVTDFSGKVHFSSTLKQVEAWTALFTETAQGKWETLNLNFWFGELQLFLVTYTPH